MDSINEKCKICESTNETVMDGLCEGCEKVWLEQIGYLSNQLSDNTSLAFLFDEATRKASEKIKRVS